MKLTNTISGDTYVITELVAEERESNESVKLSFADLETDEWELKDSGKEGVSND